MNETPITIVGHLAEDPILRFTPSGAAVANLRILSTPRTLDKQTNEWKDAETLGMNCSVWREQAENVAESLTRGAHVIATGRLVSRSWDDKDSGQKRTVMEMQADHVGPALAKATAKVTKTQRGQRTQGNDFAQSGGWGGGTGSGGPAPASDPWGAPAPAQGSAKGGTYDEPPF